ncbi:MAG: ROK family protein [Pseudomonadota bacterium]
MSILLADVGGTNIRTAWTDDCESVKDASKSPASRYRDLIHALSSRCELDNISPESAVVAVAGPVRGDTITFTNRDWTFSQRDLKDALGLRELLVVNDFSAVALSLPTWHAEDIDCIKHGATLPNNPLLALGPGTGLGVAAIVRRGNHWIPIAGEGGHCLANVRDLIPAAAERRLNQEGQLTWESMLSGPGIRNLHSALHSPQKNLPPEEIVGLAIVGDTDAISTLHFFSALLGRRAADAALLFGAWGGVFIAGDIVKAMGAQFDRAAFIKAFSANKNEFLNDVPVGLLKAEYPALKGLAQAAGTLEQETHQS